MAASTALKNVGSCIQHQAARCQASLPVVSLAPRLQSVVTKARRGPFVCCFGFYVLFICVSSLLSLLQFSSALHAKTLTPDVIWADSSPVAASQVPATEMQWAPPPSGLVLEPSNATAIPKIIHRMWRGLASDVPEEWKNATHSCQEQNPTYQQYIWTDNTARQFIGAHFAWFLPTYNEHLLSMQRVDAFRYFVLWYYGGIYLDPDVGCRQPMDPLLRDTEALLPRSWPYGVSNDLVASTANHPFIIKVALSIHDHQWSFVPAYVMAFISAGSMLVSRVLAMWLRSIKGNPGISIVPPTLFDSTEDAFFMRFEGLLPRGDEVAVSEQVFGNWLGWCGAGIALIVMATVIFGVQTTPPTTRRDSTASVPV
ncbi:mannosyl phosphorylinositol ceramide synthase SUR1 [Aspergillus sclerotioniger CBS 115572]|uniref:Mannosyl phosphorylinositol ceramide synthase SUR1 n=1 Tax=Aspergillus sclerotioniger CBS 115572 TaxID=1450535 RepID=A0A317XC01_9EURO|nr:mannosyl phosphorylinositol ceramide synthase SUR1 [Aspergillus sclerotioniger CBS 115572]PWY94488.1 mannosyl phosphorylinositol ceramide synthase SUR1 [Aspergillus sclerotioniger CBS 115572]